MVLANATSAARRRGLLIVVHRSLLALPPPAEVAAGTGSGGGVLPAAMHNSTDAVARTMAPGCFDEQPAGMPVGRSW